MITDTGNMSLRTAFNDGDTLDIGASLQGLLFRQEVIVDIDGAPYGVLRAIGITRSEMELAREQGADALVARLQAADVYPHTLRGRAAVA